MKKALIGNGGHAREVQAQMGSELVRFVDDNYWIEGNDKILPLSMLNPDEYEIMIAIASSKDREDLVNRLPKDIQFFTFIHPSAQIMSEDVIIGKGSFIGANSIITCNVIIGNHCLLNRANHIGHDCRIGNYFSAMPGSIISGNVTIGDRFYIGTNSSVREKTNVCDDVTIGMGGVVVKDITESGVYIGNPVNKLIK